jgi:hypothetical protein
MYRPRQALGVTGGWGSHISKQSGYEGDMVASHRYRPHLVQRKYSWFSILLNAGSNTDHNAAGRVLSITSLGLEPTTLWRSAVTNCTTARSPKCGLVSWIIPKSSAYIFFPGHYSLTVPLCHTVWVTGTFVIKTNQTNKPTVCVCGWCLPFQYKQD